MSELKTIKVRVTAYSRIEYSQMREMTPAQFAEYERICETAPPRKVNDMLARFVDPFIDTRDICDASEFEDVEIVRVDDKGNDLPIQQDADE